jgi:hypothetical protein
MESIRRSAAAVATIVAATAGLLAGSGILAGAASASTTFIGPLNTVTPIASTIPANGDVNPYGVAVVPRSTGNLRQGNVLVSNFNNAANAQGTGTTIVQVSPNGTVSQFAGISDPACPGGVGHQQPQSVPLASPEVTTGRLRVLRRRAGAPGPAVADTGGQKSSGQKSTSGGKSQQKPT